MSTTQATRLRKDAIGVFGIFFFVVAAVGPMAAVMGASPLVFAGNGDGAPATYVIAAALFAVFSVGYVAMSRYITNAGGFVTYIARGLGKYWGAATAVVALLTYLAITCGIYGIYAIFAHQTAIDRLGLDLPWEVWALGSLLVIAVLAYHRVELSARVLGVFLIAEVAVLLVLDIAIIFQGGDGGLSAEGLKPSHVFGGSAGIAFMWALASFGGFEATVVFSEEAKDKRRTIPRATYLAIGFIGIFYGLTTWALVQAVGGSSIQEVATKDPTGFIFIAAEQFVGTLWADIMSILVVTSFFAIALGFTNIFARYIFALGRAGILPSQTAAIHPRHGSPSTGVLTASASIALVLGGFMIADADPFTVLYTWLLALGTVALLAILCLTSVAVIVFFRGSDGREGVVKTVVAPAIAVLGFAAAIYLALTNYDVLIAGQGGAAGLLPLLIPIAAVIGLLIAHFRGDSLDFSDIGSSPPVPVPAAGRSEPAAETS